MAGVSPIFDSPSQQQPDFPTPSPLANSYTSTLWSSQPVLNISTFVVRVAAFLLSVTAAVSLTAPLPDSENRRYAFSQFSEFRYSVCATVLASLYSASQLFKTICDVAWRGHFVSDKVYDYVTFVLDQLVAYLLISSSTASISATERIVIGRLRTAAIVSDCMSFAAFFVMVVCASLSGYKLCKRIIW